MTGHGGSRRVLWGGACVACVLAGCVRGPSVLDATHLGYNRAIRKTTDEQLLLNLVRLQFREAPYFLDVSSVSAQFVFKESADVVGIINEGPNPLNPDRLDLKAGIAFEERPTISLTPLHGEDFVGKLLAPLSFDAVVLLIRSGWSIDRVLRLTVQSMNGLDNASSASGPTPQAAPQFERFAEVCKLFRRLQQKGLLELGYESRRVDVSAPFDKSGISFSDVVNAVEKGYFVRAVDNDTHVVLTEASRVLVWRIPDRAKDDFVVVDLIRRLGLEPGRRSYEIQPAGGNGTGPSADAGRTVVAVVTRSLMGSLFYLSQAVEPPNAQRAAGLVTTTQDDDGTVFDWTRVTGELLRIHSRATRPASAAVAVRYRRYWYYIDDTDLTSKSTFALLGQLFALQAGTAKSAGPVLTLPVGG